MTSVRIFTPVNRLKQVLNESTGKSENDLARTAERRVESLAPQMRAQVGQVLVGLRTLRSGDAARLADHAGEIADDAMLIAELAGAAGWPKVGEAARGVLAVLPALEGGGAKVSKALQVHLDALELLAAEPEPSADDADAILTRLAQMRRALGFSD
jgi:predicted anti-sigma-YlaC factor YlaD